MAVQEEPNRGQEIRDIHKNRDYRYFYQIIAGLFVVIIFILIGSNIFVRDDGYKVNLYTEVLSVLATILVLNGMAERREEKRRIKDLQERLVWEVGGQSNEAAKRAVDELRHQKWLTGDGGLLKGANLSRAKLQGANLMWANLKEASLVESNLHEANLAFAKLYGAVLINSDLQQADLRAAYIQEADFSSANLQEADLAEANLQSSVLVEANLCRAKLWQANLHGADLYLANLDGVNLANANLQNANLALADLPGANLVNANLQGATLTNVIMNEHTILPDRNHWEPATDLTRFSDPQHPYFWRSDERWSYAYKGRNR